MARPLFDTETEPSDAAGGTSGTPLFAAGPAKPVFSDPEPAPPPANRPRGLFGDEAVIAAGGAPAAEPERRRGALFESDPAAAPAGVPAAAGPRSLFEAGSAGAPAVPTAAPRSLFQHGSVGEAPPPAAPAPAVKSNPVFSPGSASDPARARERQDAKLFEGAELSQIQRLKLRAKDDPVLGQIPPAHLDPHWRELLPLNAATLQRFAAAHLSMNEQVTRALAHHGSVLSQLRLSETCDDTLRYLANPPKLKFMGPSLPDLERALRAGQAGGLKVQEELERLQPPAEAALRELRLAALAMTAIDLAFPDEPLLPLLRNRFMLLSAAADSLEITVVQLRTTLSHLQHSLLTVEQILSIQLPQWHLARSRG